MSRRVLAVVLVVTALVAQAKARAQHQAVAAADKRLSIRDRDARPIKKATTPRKQIQFGYTAQIAEDTAGLIVDHEVFIGQPADAELIRPAVKRIAERYGIPTTVTADKTYGTTASRQALTNLGVTTVAIAYKSNQNPPRLPPERPPARSTTPSDGGPVSKPECQP